MGNLRHHSITVQDILQGRFSPGSILSLHISHKSIQLNSVNLTKNVLRALDASHADIPPLENYPKSHFVTFKYYRGVIAFLDENYSEVCFVTRQQTSSTDQDCQAEQHLTEAWRWCYSQSHRNLEYAT